MELYISACESYLGHHESPWARTSCPHWLACKTRNVVVKHRVWKKTFRKGGDGGRAGSEGPQGEGLGCHPASGCSLPAPHGLQKQCPSVRVSMDGMSQMLLTGFWSKLQTLHVTPKGDINFGGMNIRGQRYRVTWGQRTSSRGCKTSVWTMYCITW